MDKKKIIAPAACLAIAAAVLTYVLSSHDVIVINRGIRAYGAIRTACAVAVAAAAAWTAFSAVRITRAAHRRQEYEIPEPPGKKALTEDDRNALYQELAEFRKSKWTGMPEIGKLLSQLDSMNEYQDEMGRLLEQTEYLKEKPAEIVQRVEDCMYVNIRKLLNYMRIVQTKSRDVMESKIHECADKNAALLQKTDDFVVAVVDYVNGDMVPGEEQKTKDYVDSYMFVVLEAIELPETYLR